MEAEPQKVSTILEQTLNAFFDAIEDFLFVLDEQGRIQRCNRAVTRKLGYSEEELQGKPVTLVHPPEFRESALEIVLDMLSGKVEFCPIPLLAKDGRHVPVQTRVVRGFWAGGSALFGVSRDLSAIRASEERFTAAFNTSPLPMAFSRIEDGTFLDINPAFSHVLGYTRDEVLGQPSTKLGLFVRPEQRAALVQVLKERGLARDHLVDVQTRRGDVLSGLFSAGVIHEENRQVLMTVMQDVTEHQHMQDALTAREALLTAVLESASEAKAALDLQGKLLIANQKFLRMLKAPALLSEGTSLVEPLQHLLPLLDNPEPLERVLEQMRTAQSPDLETPPPTPGPEHMEVLHWKDGQVMEWIRHPFSRGRNVSCLWTFRDITERYRAQQALEAATARANTLAAQAEAASRAKGAFLANMSHEIRTPMNAMIGLTRLLLETHPTPAQQDYLAKVLSASQTLLSILNDILDYSKIEAGRLEIESSRFSMDDVLQRVSDLFGLRAEEKGLELVFDVSPDTPQELMGDALRLTQVLDNLVGNAIKFADTGEVRVQVECQHSDVESVMLRFSVTDQGIGMTSEQLKHLFQPFFQADGSISRRYGGTGLGLAICTRLIQLMNGHLEVSSTAGVGSCFSFVVRLLHAPARTQQPQNYLAPQRILVADGHESVRYSLARQLSAWSMEVQLAGTGEQVLELLSSAEAKHQPIQILLLDWRLPGLNGLEVARSLQQRRAQGLLRAAPKLVIMSTLTRDRLLYSLGGLCPDDLLAKPVTPSALLNLLIAQVQPSDMGEEAQAVVRHHVSGSRLRTLSTPMQRLFPGARILVAEDNPLNQQVALEFMQRLGVQTTLARDGQEAVALALAAPFDLILMDVQMPDVDGLEATRRLKAAKPLDCPPIVAMTAAAMQEDRDRCLAAGMVDHISKPIEPERLVSVLRQWLPPHLYSDAFQETQHEMPSPSARPWSGMAAAQGLDEALERLGGDQTLLLTLLSAFQVEVDQALKHLLTLLHENHLEEAAVLLHRLRGAAANLGMSKLAESAQMLERELTTQRAFTQLDVLLTDAGETYAVLTQLQRPVREMPVEPDEHPLVHAQRMAQLGRLLEQLAPYVVERELAPVELLEAIDVFRTDALLGIEVQQLLQALSVFDQGVAQSQLKALEVRCRE